MIKNLDTDSNLEAPTTFTLSNGLRVIYRYIPNSKITDVRLTVKSGAIYEPGKYKAGTAHFLEHIVHEKTEKYEDKASLKDILLKNGGQSNATTYNNEKMFFYASVLNQFSEDAFDYVSQVVFHPILTEAAVEKHRSIITQEMFQIMKQPGNKVYTSFRGLAYSGTQYALHTIGTEESIASITLSELQEFYNERFVPENCLLAIYGDIGEEEARALAKKYFDREIKHLRNDEPRPISIETDILTKKYSHIVSEDSQALMWYGGISGGKTDSQYFKLTVLLRILAGDTGSILYKILRDDKHLTYSISTFNNAAETAGFSVLNST